VGLYLAPGILGIDGRDVNCVPCDIADVPFFDRWAVTELRAVLSDVSSGLVAALAAGTWLSLATRGPSGRRYIVASAQSAALATGFSVVIQEIVGRDRPVFYTDAAGDIDPAETRPSFPSGHTAIAFALAASYVLSGAGPSGAAKIVAVAAATVVATLRVASGRHFPSDVVAGAVVGVGSAFLVHTLRF
jgi:membrane-associated phospholipid phosphatase